MSETTHTPPRAQPNEGKTTDKPAVDKPNRDKLVLPDGHERLLLHSCCAPCSGEPMEAMLDSGIDFTIFFYNPNIHPQKEYELRK